MEGSAESLPDAVPANFPDVFPDLKDVPLVYVLHVLAQQRDLMLAGLDAISSLPPSLLRSEMPESLRVPTVSPNDVIWPTHVLSIECEDFDPGQDIYIPIFPIHALVLAAHCSSIPCLVQACSVEDGTTNLPIVNLSLPFPQYFDILRTFMYTHRVDIALQHLLKLPDLVHDGSGGDVHVSSIPHGDLQQMSQTFGILASAVLLRQYQDIERITQDMVSLGFHNSDLWAAIERVRLALQGEMKERHLT
ncbi:hypothetical protein B0H14DRAFT_3630316 [Mycena olivaceomarginata]|nr:hypothetical protein B0H14DRAFT_3630316 [Mycena olivaceomarginata]